MLHHEIEYSVTRSQNIACTYHYRHTRNNSVKTIVVHSTKTIVVILPVHREVVGIYTQVYITISC